MMCVPLEAVYVISYCRDTLYSETRWVDQVDDGGSAPVVVALELAGDVEEEVAQLLGRLWPVKRPQVVDDSLVVDEILVRLEVRHADDELMPVQDIQGHFQFGLMMDTRWKIMHMSGTWHLSCTPNSSSFRYTASICKCNAHLHTVACAPMMSYTAKRLLRADAASMLLQSGRSSAAGSCLPRRCSSSAVCSSSMNLLLALCDGCCSLEADAALFRRLRPRQQSELTPSVRSQQQGQRPKPPARQASYSFPTEKRKRMTVSSATFPVRFPASQKTEQEGSQHEIARHCYNTAQEDTWDGALDVEARVGPHQVLQQPPLR